MTKVFLVGGTNDGRILDVKHGTSVSVVKRISLPEYPLAEIAATGPLPDREIYERPAEGPTVINGIERWY